MSLDSKFEDAASDLRSSLEDRDTPAFTPRPPVGRSVAAAAMVVGLIGGGVWLARSGVGSTEPTSVVAGEVTSTVAAPIDDTSTTEDAISGMPLRITDAPVNEAIVPVYSGTQAFNADGSLVLLYQAGGDDSGPVVLAADDWSVTTSATNSLRSVTPTDIEDFSWDTDDPSTIRFVEAGSNRLVALDVMTGQTSVVYAFDDCDEISSGAERGSVDAGSGVFGFLCSVGDEVVGLVSVDVATGEARAAQRAGLTAESVGVRSLASGDGFVLIGDDGISLVDSSLTDERVILTGADVASLITTTAADGADVLVATIFGAAAPGDAEAVGSAVLIDVVTGELTTIVGPSTGYAYPPSGTVLSLPALARPGVFALVSPSTGAEDGLTGRIVVVDLTTATPTVSDVGAVQLEAPAGLAVWSGVTIALAPNAQTLIVSGTTPSEGGTPQSIDSFLIAIN